MQRFRVAATGHSVNYFPEYLATARGMFADRGLEVAVDVPDPWQVVLADLTCGRAEAVLGGIWVPAMYAGTHEYRAFAQLSARAAMTLLAREPVTEFDWSFLVGKVVLVAGGGHSSPYLYLSSVLLDAGVDVASIRFLHDLPDTMFQELFRAGVGDVLVTDPLTAEAMQRSRQGHAIAHLAEIAPGVPWSIYYSTPARRAETEPLVADFVQGLSDAFAWLAGHDVREAAEVAAAYWPDLDLGLVLDVLGRLQSSGVWESMTVDRSALGWWQGGLVAAGLIPTILDYERLVDGEATVAAFPHLATAKEL